MQNTVTASRHNVPEHNSVRFRSTSFAKRIAEAADFPAANFKYFVTLTFRNHITSIHTVEKRLICLFRKVRRRAYGKHTSFLKANEKSPLMAVWGIEKCKSGRLHVHLVFSDPPKDATKVIDLRTTIESIWQGMSQNSNVLIKFPKTEMDRRTVTEYTLKNQGRDSDMFGLEGWKESKNN